ncbi:MAG: glycogen debranching protein [Cyanobacteria bacterium SID2]|nr:glycogen debranching protein [Cyanobacteria bacterium SID2]MBP0002267.1 glycogen debranching protein [Cyanobacteria bacterium SBC]
MTTVWVCEQLDSMGLVQACIASCDETQARECLQSFQDNLDEHQKSEGWTARLRTVESWDEVPVTPLKLSR